MWNVFYGHLDFFQNRVSQWIDMVEAYMVEVEWVKRGRIPTLEDYIENRVTTSGTLSSIYLLVKERNITCEEKGRKEILHLIYGLWNDLNDELVTPNAMILPMIKVVLNTARACQVAYQHDDSYLSSVETHVQSFFFKLMISYGVTLENAQDLLDPYPKLFTLAGTILRLWDDLGTLKGRKEILHLIYGLWNDLNAELVTPNAMLLPMIKVMLNTERAYQVAYQHDDSYLSSVETHVQSFFFKPVDI
ncbi:hypothetical protein L1987_33147 [Smallanthus sonchifolius]|uniref:Uncharacterized protein n=1 Tax=Smallanthus sonchifolius TaxID=185202 RepID=A0ACB9HRF8_9ASTR|nr:hypothetical protein L1987_33147 [Smallanthus sonchifolius]